MSDLRFGNIPDFSEENPGEESTPTRRFLPSPNVMAVVSTILALVGTVVLFSSHTLSTGHSTTTTMKEVTKASSLISKPSISKKANLKTKINFTFNRVGYPVVSHFAENADPLKKYAFLNQYVAVIEPNVDMEFAIYDSEEHARFTYSVCSTKDMSCQTGKWTSNKNSSPGTVKFDCAPHETFEISVKERDSDDNLIGTASGTAVCLYVRREMRSLTAEDKAKFITTSAVLNSVPDDKGYKLYGKDYMSSSAMVKLHHYNAAQQDQDHIHEGNGFLLQHLKMTNLFESSLQSVDSSVHLPYWDFTIDHSKGLSAYNSDVFGSDVYGTMTQPAHLNNGYLYQKDTILSAKIPDGLWKNLKVEDSPYPEIPSGYGYMRAPWNMNPSPYVSRFTQLSKGDILQLPTCAIHYDIMQYDSLMDFYYKVSLEPHATVHSLAGGIYGCDMLTPLVEAGYITSPAAVCNDWIFVLKQLYRAGYTTPKTGCVAADDIQDSTCGFTCKAGAEKDLVDLMVSFFPTAVDTNKPDFGRVMAEFVCNGGDGGRIFPGEHLESASPADPSFWVIHPTLERLLHAKLLAGGFEDEKWATDPKGDYVCKLASCYDLATDTNAYFDSCCYGHYEDDKMYDGSRDKTTGPTNGKFQAASDPRSDEYSMPYIYDSFSWGHCDEDFDALLVDMKTDANNRAAAPAAADGRRTAERKVPRPASQEKVRDMKQKTVAYNNAKAAKDAAKKRA